jgi:putative ABC transport system substrate-binding protein
MSRRALLRSLPWLALWTAYPALAQRRDRPARIATLDDSREESRARDWAAFRRRLQELGHVEGKTYVIEPRWARTQSKRLPALAAELAALKPDVIVTASTPAGLAAKQATSGIPIVALGASDPVASGLVASLARPEANVTGISVVTWDIGDKWLELLREIVPQAKSVAFITYTGNPASMRLFGLLRERAKPFGIAVQALDGRDPANVEHAFEIMSRERVDAFIVSSAGAVVSQRRQIAQAAARLRIPGIYARREYVEAGGLMSYGAEYSALFPRAAEFVHRILQGARPAELPFELAATFRLVVNNRVVKALGLKVPESLRARVDEVIE